MVFTRIECLVAGRHMMKSLASLTHASVVSRKYVPVDVPRVEALFTKTFLYRKLEMHVLPLSVKKSFTQLK
jgi:hypothetical protein